jgi:predicted TIM-barrel fold metal-dependent hydrolase
MRIDIHCHIIGNGSGNTGCKLILPRHRELHGRYMLRHLGLPQSCLYKNLDELYVGRMREMIDNSTLDKAVILAHENTYDNQGKLIENYSPFYVPNSYVLRLAKSHKQFLAGVSIHPGKNNAIEELTESIGAGAALMKCLPNVQNINCSDKRYDKFWEIMAASGLPLLAHTGGEFSLPVFNKHYEDPAILRRPLEIGVKVIAAHAASPSAPWQTNYIPKLVSMMNEFPNLYADNSALNTPLRAAAIKDTLKEPLASRIVYGSDLPIPISALWTWMRGMVSWGDYRKIDKDRNILARDVKLKEHLGYSEQTFTRGAELINQ